MAEFGPFAASKTSKQLSPSRRLPATQKSDTHPRPCAAALARLSGHSSGTARFSKTTSTPWPFVSRLTSSLSFDAR